MDVNGSLPLCSLQWQHPQSTQNAKKKNAPLLSLSLLPLSAVVWQSSSFPWLNKVTWSQSMIVCQKKSGVCCYRVWGSQLCRHQSWYHFLSLYFNIIWGRKTEYIHVKKIFIRGFNPKQYTVHTKIINMKEGILLIDANRQTTDIELRTQNLQPEDYFILLYLYFILLYICNSNNIFRRADLCFH